MIENLPALSGRGADLGCGLGILAHAVLASPKVTALALVDNDRRAVEASRRNVDDPRVTVTWADARATDAVPERLDFVVMNPPFHDGGAEDRALGQAFIRRAAASLRPGGTLWLTANTHLPYEATLGEVFKEVTQRAPPTATRSTRRANEPRAMSAKAKVASVRLDRLLANLGYGSRREIQMLPGPAKWCSTARPCATPTSASPSTRTCRPASPSAARTSTRSRAWR